MTGSGASPGPVICPGTVAAIRVKNHDLIGFKENARLWRPPRSPAENNRKATGQDPPAALRVHKKLLFLL